MSSYYLLIPSALSIIATVYNEIQNDSAELTTSFGELRLLIRLLEEKNKKNI